MRAQSHTLVPSEAVSSPQVQGLWSDSSVRHWATVNSLLDL